MKLKLTLNMFDDDLGSNRGTFYLTLIVMGGELHQAKFSEKCPCLHNDNIAFIKQISLFDTALVMKSFNKNKFTKTETR